MKKPVWRFRTSAGEVYPDSEVQPKLMTFARERTPTLSALCSRDTLLQSGFRFCLFRCQWSECPRTEMV